MDENTGSTPTPPAPQAPPPPPPPTGGAPAAAGGRPGPASDTSKILAALGYLFGIVALIAILIEPYKNEGFVKFHAFQALGLWAAGILVQFLNVIPIIGWIVAAVAGLAIFVYAIILAIKSFQGEYMEIPLVYDMVKGFIEG